MLTIAPPRGALLLPRAIGHAAVAAPARRCHFAREGIETGGVDVDRVNMGAELAENFGRRPADARGGAGDNGRPSGKIQFRQHVRSPSLWTSRRRPKPLPASSAAGAPALRFDCAPRARPARLAREFRIETCEGRDASPPP